MYRDVNEPPLAATPRGTASVERGEPDRLTTLLRFACSTLQASRGGIALLTAEGCPTQHFTLGIGDEAAAALARGDWLTQLACSVLRRERPLRTPPGPADTPAPPAALLPAGPLLVQPLAGHGRVWALLYLCREAGAAPFTAVDEDTLHNMCGLVKPEALCEEGQRLARQRLMIRVARAAADSLDLSSLVAVALCELERLVPLSVLAVWLAEGDACTPRLTLAAASDSRPDGSRPIGLDCGLTLSEPESELLRCAAGAALYVDLDRPDEPWGPLADRLAAAGATSSLAVPLHCGERVVGILHAVCFRSTGLTKEQIQLCYFTADLLGPAMSSCQLYDRLRTAYDDLREAQQRLIFAEKMRALGELAGGMAHEFNNALCSTLGFIELALRSPRLDPALQSDLHAARNCAWDAARIVRRVQDFARQRSTDASRSRLDVNELIRQTLRIARLRTDNSPRTATIAFELDLELHQPMWVEGDATELRQVVTNLIFNAIDAMPEGGTVTLRTRTAGTRVLFQVQDTGVGIPLQIQHRLFEPFFTTKGERGNGLGLSIVYGIVQRHGGAIDVDSPPGCGATFTVQLPAYVSITSTNADLVRQN